MPFIFSFMMSALLYSISYVCVAENTSSITSYSSVQAPLVNQSLLLDITAVGQYKLVAVGQYGHIIMSADGESWHQSNVPVQSTLTKVYFYNKNLGWAVGHDATILHSQDGGVSWSIQLFKPRLEKPFFDIVFKTSLEGIAVGAKGLFYRTIDGGITWNKEHHSEFLSPDNLLHLSKLKRKDEDAYLDEHSSLSPHFNHLMLDGRTLYLVGEHGIISKSNDFGISWSILEHIYNGSFYDIIRTLKSKLLVVGLHGHVFRSSKSGTPWTKHDTNTVALINDIVLTDDGRIFLLAANGVLLESNDDGQSYRLKKQKDGKALISGVWFNGQLIVASEAGVKIVSL